MVQLTIERLTKSFGHVRAVDNIDLTVEEGEFLTLLGPSGCGKSTTLGAIAGLDRPDSGRIKLGEHVFFDGATSTFVPPEGRGIGLVFQSYALWPHMTVRKNLEFPLLLRKVPVAERKRRIDEVLDLVEMGSYADRYPFALSGGQQQRVALARTLVYRPRLLLLDEPLSNLDAKLRERARLWLRDIQSRINVTTVYVTHDQTEALALSDRIAVMSAGKIVQLASPTEIYHSPASPFVADFIGSANIFSGEVLHVEDGITRVQLGGGRTLVTPSPPPPGTSGQVMIAVRPEKILFVRDNVRDGKDNIFQVNIEARSFLGARHMVLARLGDVALRIECEWEPGTEVANVHIPAEACVLFNAPKPLDKAATVVEAA